MQRQRKWVLSNWIKLYRPHLDRAEFGLRSLSTAQWWHHCGRGHCWGVEVYLEGSPWQNLKVDKKWHIRLICAILFVLMGEGEGWERGAITIYLVYLIVLIPTRKSWLKFHSKSNDWFKNGWIDSRARQINSQLILAPLQVCRYCDLSTIWKHLLKKKKKKKNILSSKSNPEIKESLKYIFLSWRNVHVYITKTSCLKSLAAT